MGLPFFSVAGIVPVLDCVIGQWVGEVCNHRVRIAPSTGLPGAASVAVSGIFERGQLVIEPWLDDPMPDDDSGI